MNVIVFDNEKSILSKIKSGMSGKANLKRIATNEEELLMILNDDIKDVIMLNINMLTDNITDILRDDRHYIIAYSDKSNVEDFKTSLDIGAKDFLNLPIKKPELLKSLEKANFYIKNSQDMQKSAKKRSAKTIMFMSTKGGIGKSVIVTNLAYILQKQFDKQILLIDSIPRFGTLDILLDIADKKSITYIDVESESDEDLLQDIEDNTCVHSSGLHLLRAGDIYNEPLIAQNLQVILEAVQSKYDYILIDTDSTFNEFNLAMVEFAHTVFFISTLSISCIRNLNFGIETIKSIYYSIDKIKILINRFNKGGELTIADVEKFLKHKVSSVIPEDYETVIRSVNKGTPFLTEANVNPELRNAFRVLAGITTGQKVSVNAEDLMKEETNLIKQITSMFTEK